MKKIKSKVYKIKNPDYGLIGTAWVQVTNATPNFGIICQKKGVAYGSLLSVKY
jgi:seryl-tRNA synthetase